VREKSASKRSFQEGESMSMLSFRVIFVSLVFNTVIAFVLCLVESSKCSSSFFLKVIMFAKNSSKIPLGLFGSGLSRFWTEFWSSNSVLRTPYVGFYRRPEILEAWRESFGFGSGSLAWASCHCCMHV
jgi:hypothetical protein